ncbi:MAG: hypothetical protein RIE08_02780 [Acidimicrobiales bacterium]
MRRDRRRAMAAVFAVIIVLAMLAAVIAPLIAATEELIDGDVAIEPVDNARYVSLFDDGPLAGTEAQTAAPTSTGDPTADERLRTMAVGRDYAVDISEGTERFAQFESTAAFAWLSADDYTNARRFGFVPSYPPGVAQQGPNPEAWEYVWVGAAAVQVPAIGFTG